MTLVKDIHLYLETIFPIIHINSTVKYYFSLKNKSSTALRFSIKDNKTESVTLICCNNKQQPIAH